MKIKTPIILISILLFTSAFVRVNSFGEENNKFQYPVNSTYFPISDYNWTKGAFIPHYITGYAEETPENFNTSITSTEIHIYENSSGYYHLFAGVYCRIPALENTMNVSFEGRASSSRYDQVIMGVGVINSSNMKYLGFKRPYDYQDTGISTPHDTGYNSFSYNFNTTSADEILLFLCYIEATAAYWNQSVWFRNLVVSFNGTIFTPIPPVPTITMNNSFVIMTLFTVIIFAATIKASKKIKKYS